MGLVYRRRMRLNRTTLLNASTSGLSVSKRFGRFTVNSRGRVSVRLLPGLSFRFGGKR